MVKIYNLKAFRPDLSVSVIQHVCKSDFVSRLHNQLLADTVSFTGVKEKGQLQQDKAEINTVLKRVGNYYQPSQKENLKNFDNDLQELCKIQNRNKNNPSLVLDSISEHISGKAKDSKKISLAFFGLGLAFVKDPKDANKYVNDYAQYIFAFNQAHHKLISPDKAKLIAFQNLYAISSGYLSVHDYKKFNNLFNEEKQQRLFGKAYNEHIEKMLKYGGVYKDECGHY